MNTSDAASMHYRIVLRTGFQPVAEVARDVFDEQRTDRTIFWLTAMRREPTRP